MNTLIEIIEANKESPIAVIRAYATIEGFSGKEVTEALKEAGISKAKIGFNDTFYTYLSDGVRTEAEIKAYILGDGEFGETSDNVVNHLSTYLAIGRLAIRLYSLKV